MTGQRKKLLPVETLTSTSVLTATNATWVEPKIGKRTTIHTLWRHPAFTDALQSLLDRPLWFSLIPINPLQNAYQWIIRLKIGGVMHALLLLLLLQKVLLLLTANQGNRGDAKNKNMDSIGIRFSKGTSPDLAVQKILLLQTLAALR